MAAPHRNLADALATYQLEITEMKRADHTHDEMLSWLQEMGIRVSLSTLSRQLRGWGLRRHTVEPV
jgi:arginine repressor